MITCPCGARPVVGVFVSATGERGGWQLAPSLQLAACAEHVPDLLARVTSWTVESVAWQLER